MNRFGEKSNKPWYGPPKYNTIGIENQKFQIKLLNPEKIRVLKNPVVSWKGTLTILF